MNQFEENLNRIKEFVKKNKTNIVTAKQIPPLGDLIPERTHSHSDIVIIDHLNLIKP